MRRPLAQTTALSGFGAGKVQNPYRAARVTLRQREPPPSRCRHWDPIATMIERSNREDSSMVPKAEGADARQTNAPHNPYSTRVWTISVAFVTASLCMLAIATSISDMRQYPGADLRPKIAGARALSLGLDPYITNTTDSDYLKTNSIPYYTPALLMLYVPLSAQSYVTQRAIYFWMDWLLAAASLLLLQNRFCRTARERILCWTILSVFVICSYSFRLHLERGQYYMLLLFLTCYAAVSIKNNWTTWPSCVPTALLILLRPTYILILCAVLISLRRWNWVTRVSLVAAMLFLLTLPAGGIQRWHEFFHVIQARGAEHLGELAPSYKVQQSLQPGSAPRRIEGLDFSEMLPNPAVNGTFIGLSGWGFNTLAKRSLDAQRISAPSLVGAINTGFLALALLTGIALAIMASRHILSLNTLIAFAFLWPIVVESFGPERYFYTAVLEVLPLFLIALEVYELEGFRFRLSSPSLLLLALGGLVLPAAFQIGIMTNMTRLTGYILSALILLALPAYLGIYCAYRISVSPNRVSQSRWPPF